jgi:hypothetical protein
MIENTPGKKTGRLPVGHGPSFGWKPGLRSGSAYRRASSPKQGNKKEDKEKDKKKLRNPGGSPGNPGKAKDAGNDGYHKKHKCP